MTETEYSLANGIRRSDLWKLKRSPAHFRYEMDHPQEPSPAMVLGAAVHAAVLTPDEFKRQYCVADFDGRTKEGKAARQAAMEAGKTLLTKEQFDTVNGIVESIRNDRFASRLLLTGQHETAYFWKDDVTGCMCKCRTDCETDIDGQHVIVDLKTCADAGTEAFMREAVKLGYSVQCAMYSEGVKAVTGKDSLFVFVCVEKTPPFAINILQADEAFRLYGTDEYRYLMGLYAQCREKNEWPGYAGLSGSVNELTLPAWLKKGVE